MQAQTPNMPISGDFANMVPLAATAASSLPNLQPMSWPATCSLAPVISLPDKFEGNQAVQVAIPDLPRAWFKAFI